MDAKKRRFTCSYFRKRHSSPRSLVTSSEISRYSLGRGFRSPFGRRNCLGGHETPRAPVERKNLSPAGPMSPAGLFASNLRLDALETRPTVSALENPQEECVATFFARQNKLCNISGRFSLSRVTRHLPRSQRTLKPLNKERSHA